MDYGELRRLLSLTMELRYTHPTLGFNIFLIDTLLKLCFINISLNIKSDKIHKLYDFPWLAFIREEMHFQLHFFEYLK